MNSASVKDSITSFCGDDEESASEMLALVKKSVADSVKEIEPLEMSNHSKEIGAIVHRLRFTFSVLGTSELLAMAVSIEEAVDEKAIDQYVEDLYLTFRGKFTELNEILKEL